jgi:nitrogenase molybdenum-iron protein alpha chain
MPINLKTSVVESREQRLGTVIGWQGSAAELAEQSAYARGDCNAKCGQKARRICELRSPFTQGSVCSEQMVECQAGNVRGAVLPGRQLQTLECSPDRGPAVPAGIYTA